MNGNINNNQQEQWYLHTFAVKTEDKAKIGAYLKKILAPGEQYAYINWNNSEYRYQVHTTKQNIGILGNITTQKSSANSKTFKQTASYKNAVVFTQPSQVMNNAINNNMNMQNRVHQNQMQVNKNIRQHNNNINNINKINNMNNFNNINPNVANNFNNKAGFADNQINNFQKNKPIPATINKKQNEEHSDAIYSSYEPDFLYFGSDNKVYTGRLVSNKMAMMKLANETFIEEYKKRCISAGKQQKYFVLNSKIQKQVDELLGQYTRVPNSTGNCHIINSEYYIQRYNELYNQLREKDYEPNQQRIVNQMVFYELKNKFGKGLNRK